MKKFSNIVERDSTIVEVAALHEHGRLSILLLEQRQHSTQQFAPAYNDWYTRQHQQNQPSKQNPKPQQQQISFQILF
jgi:hypothetical protein